MRLTDTEAMLWTLEQDPELASTMASILILEKSPDRLWLRNALSRAVLAVPRMRERVVKPGFPGTAPEWRHDASFDLDHHLRFMRLATPASADVLRSTVSQLINDPFDRSRPLWQCTVLDGLTGVGGPTGGRTAVLVKLHHSIADGLGALDMANQLFDFGDLGVDPGPIDLSAELSALAAVHEPESPGAAATEPGAGLVQQAERFFGRVTEAAQVVAEAAQGTTDGEPSEIVKVFGDRLRNGGARSGSTLWSNRSRNRRVEWLSIPLGPLKDRASERNLRVNDMFVGAAAEAALRYHDEFGVQLPEISTTAVVNMRRPEDPAAANIAAPAPMAVSGHGTSTEDRLKQIHDQMHLRREALRARPELLGSFTGIAALLPAALTVSLAKDQARTVDLATSNIPGPTDTAFLGGQPIRRWIPFGPVAGTAVNLTLLTYSDVAHVGMHIDPAAITDTKMFKSCLRAGFGDLGVRVRSR